LIAKGFRFAKTFATYSMKILREKKCLRDHDTVR